MSKKVLRYLGVGKESVFGTEVDPQFHLDIASASLDSPAEPDLMYTGGISRFLKKIVPGAYIIPGGAEFAADVSQLWYILWLLLGSKSTVDTGVTQVNDEAHPTGVGETTLELDFASAPIVPGSFEFFDAVPTKVAEDNGFGKIVEVTASGVTGSIDYTKDLDGTAGGSAKLAGLTESIAYTADYKYGHYVHTLAPQDTDELLSATLDCGKDVFEHTFLGCCFNSLDLTIEREFATVVLDILGQKDKKEILTAEEDLKLLCEPPIPFHGNTFKLGDKDGAFVDRSADVLSVSLTINNTADAEAGLGLNSRFPNAVYAGDFELAGEVTLQFANTNEKEDFWGGTEPTDSPVEKTIELTLNNGGATGFGSIVSTLPRVRLSAVNIQPSGRERLNQVIPFKGAWHKVDEEILSVVATVLTNYV